MSKFERFNRSTGSIAMLAAGIVLLAAAEGAGARRRPRPKANMCGPGNDPATASRGEGKFA